MIIKNLFLNCRWQCTVTRAKLLITSIQVSQATPRSVVMKGVHWTATRWEEATPKSIRGEFASLKTWLCAAFTFNKINFQLKPVDHKLTASNFLEKFCCNIKKRNTLNKIYIVAKIVLWLVNKMETTLNENS